MFAGLAVVLVVVAIVYPGSPLVSHEVCRSKVAAINLETFTLLGMVNAPPYGANASGTVKSLIPAWSMSLQITAVNSSVDSVFVQSTYNITSFENISVNGLGADTYCTSPFAVSVDLHGGQFQGGSPLVPPPSNMSDIGEPRVSYLLWEGPNGSVERPTAYYENGFTVSNMPNISTCGGPAQVRVSVSKSLTLWYPYNDTGTVRLVPVTTTTVVNTYTYVFPANFGTWEVDNLSAPGGPGGGWSFAYSPCP